MITGIILNAQQGEHLIQHKFDEVDRALDAYKQRITSLGGDLYGVDLTAYIDGVLHAYQSEDWHRVH